MKKIILSIALLLLSGCAANVHHMTTPYDRAAFVKYEQTGTGAVSGQAFLKTLGGDVKYAAGNTIYLIESTPYTDELYRAAERNQPISEETLNPDFKLYARQVTADGEGEFTFDNLPAGKYYVWTTITWYVSQYRQSGGGVTGEVVVRDGETAKIILTRG